MNPILRRVFIVLTVPVWVPAMIVVAFVWLACGLLFMTLGGVGYYIATGEDITQSKYNIFGI